MDVVRRVEQRTTETPNAVMTTLVSPTLGGAGQALWEVRMAPGAAGPEHDMSGEQLWTVRAGALTVELDGVPSATLSVGDSVVLPPGRQRRLLADPRDGATALVTGPGDAHALLPDGTDRGVPGWIA